MHADSNEGGASWGWEQNEAWGLRRGRDEG